MFDSLSERLNAVLDRLTRRGALSEGDVDAALQEVRRALVEADVALDVARAFTDEVKKRAVGIEVIKSVTPGQMVVKIVHDQLVETLGASAQPIDLNAPAPVAIMMVGLQGSGKTTTTAKVAKRLAETMKRKTLMASLDTRRPAAMEQLAVLGKQVGIDTLPIVAGQTPVQIATRALQAARLGGYDVVLLDTAGRITLDEAMMNEAAEVRRAASPHEVLLVADSLTGQDAVNLARSFNERVGLTGIVLTRIDGDGRGGAALSMRAVTGKPIKLLGTGEKLDAIEDFDPARVAGRILGMGDIVALVEKAATTIDAEKAARVAEKMRKGAFDLADLREQLTQMQNMGGMSGLMTMLPGHGEDQKSARRAQLDEKVLKRQMAIIDSMTPAERRNPDVLKASRKRRIAAGSGTKPEDINKLLKMHRTMADVMKAMGGAKRGPMAGLANMLGLGGGLGGGMPSPEQMAKLAEKMPGGLPPNMPGLPPNLPGLPEVCRADCQAGFRALVRSCPADCRRDFRASEKRNDLDPAARTLFRSGLARSERDQRVCARCRRHQSDASRRRLCGNDAFRPAPREWPANDRASSGADRFALFQAWRDARPRILGAVSAAGLRRRDDHARMARHLGKEKFSSRRRDHRFARPHSQPNRRNRRRRERPRPCHRKSLTC